MRDRRAAAPWRRQVDEGVHGVNRAAIPLGRCVRMNVPSRLLGHRVVVYAQTRNWVRPEKGKPEKLATTVHAAEADLRALHLPASPVVTPGKVVSVCDEAPGHVEAHRASLEHERHGWDGMLDVAETLRRYADDAGVEPDRLSLSRLGTGRVDFEPGVTISMKQVPSRQLLVFLKRLEADAPGLLGLLDADGLTGHYIPDSRLRGALPLAATRSALDDLLAD